MVLLKIIRKIGRAISLGKSQNISFKETRFFQILFFLEMFLLFCVSFRQNFKWKFSDLRKLRGKKPVAGITSRYLDVSYRIYSSSIFLLNSLVDFLTKAENTHRRGRNTICLVSSFTWLDLTKEENIPLFVCSEPVESNLVKLYSDPFSPYGEFSMLELTH